MLITYIALGLYLKHYLLEITCEDPTPCLALTLSKHLSPCIIIIYLSVLPVIRNSYSLLYPCLFFNDVFIGYHLYHVQQGLGIEE